MLGGRRGRCAGTAQPEWKIFVIVASQSRDVPGRLDPKQGDAVYVSGVDSYEPLVRV